MNFELSRTEKMIQDAVVEFAKKEFPPEMSRELDEKEEMSREVFVKMARADWFSLPIRQKYGGTGGSITEALLLIHNLAKYFAPAAFGYILHLMHAFLLDLHGSPEQKEYFLPKMARGELLISIAMTEPSGGTDALNMSSYAERNGDVYLLNGQKVWISLADISDYLMTVMRTDLNPSKKSHGITLFLSESKNPKIKINPIRKLGYRALHCCEVFYDQAAVPASNIIGQVNHGLYHLLDTLNIERLAAGALALGVGEAAFEASLKYAKERTAFNRPIGQYQHIQRYISDMAVALEQAKLLLYKGAWLYSNNKPAVLESNMAKLACTEAAVQVSSDAMRIFGALGFSMEYDIQRYFRDSRLGLFSPVSNEMIRNIICEQFNLPRSY